MFKFLYLCFLLNLASAEAPVLFDVVRSCAGKTYPDGKGQGDGRLETPLSPVRHLENPLLWEESRRGGFTTCLARQRNAQVLCVISVL